jgi:hypothetical protein
VGGEGLYDRLEECINYAAKRLRPRARPVLLAKAALVLEDFERIQKALQVESRKRQGLKKRAAKR